MKKILLPLIGVVMLCACGGADSSRSFLLEEEEYENPHMPKAEAQKY